MRSTAHAIIGGASAFAASKTGLLPVEPLTILAGCFGALLPDIDHPSSWVGSRTKPVSLIIAGIFGHRGITHSLLAVLALVALLAFYAKTMPGWASAVAVGYLSHLAADWCTPAGVPLLWPNKHLFHSPVTIRTGGLIEGVVALAVLGGTILWATKTWH